MHTSDLINRKLALPETIDSYFLLLRFLTVAAGLLWYVIIPYDSGRTEILAWLLAVYAVYSCLLYVAIYRRPQAIRVFYSVTLGVDLLFVYVLVAHVGRLVGSYFLAFYLLVAMHSFYFGLAIGLVGALFSSLLYTATYLSSNAYLIVPWPDFLLRITFLFLIALSLGLLAGREKAMRRELESLNRDLLRKNTILEQTYRYLSIGKLIGEIAEGINGPCGTIAARSELLMYEARDRNLDASFVKGLKVINHCAHQVAQVIKSLLTFSKQKVSMESVDVNQLIEETLLLMEVESMGKSVRVEKDLTPTLPPVKGDPYELKGVLINLISNAIDAMPTGGKIAVSTELSSNDSGEVRCTIADSGTGIPAEELDRIFNPFFTTKQHNGGVGLGLSTSLSVMKKHNGMITVRSKPGEGTSFSLTLPSYSA